VVITRKANGRIGWAAVGLGGAVERATTQSLKIRLEPVVELSDGSYTEDFAIAEQHAGRQRFGTRPDAGGGPGRSSPSTA
jgi:hypothetical protein